MKRTSAIYSPDIVAGKIDMVTKRNKRMSATYQVVKHGQNRMSASYKLKRMSGCGAANNNINVTKRRSTLQSSSGSLGVPGSQSAYVNIPASKSYNSLSPVSGNLGSSPDSGLTSAVGSVGMTGNGVLYSMTSDGIIILDDRTETPPLESPLVRELIILIKGDFFLTVLQSSCSLWSLALLSCSHF